MRAGAGCYAAGATKRICLDCYVSEAGSYPMPAGAPPSFGGAFANGKELVQSFKQGVARREEVMDEVSRTIAGEAGGFQPEVGGFTKGIREKREAFWKEMPDEVQEYRNEYNKKRQELIGGMKEKAVEASDWAREKANSIFDSVGDLF